MRLLGLACGSTDGNTEILLRQALHSAEATAPTVSVEMARLADLAIPAGRPGTLPADIADDRPWIIEKLIACDALIIAAPVYTRSPPGILKLLLDRAFGPNVDVAAVMRVRDGQQSEDPRYQTLVLDERLLKPRVGALLSLGGATSADWTTFGLPLLHMATFSMHIAIVDQVQLLRSTLPDAALFNSAAIERAAALGHHVALEIGKPFDDTVYHGAPGICPVCHCNLIVPHRDEAECATCAARGQLRLEDGVYRLIVSDEGRRRSILTLAGKHLHQAEIDAVSATGIPRLAEVPALCSRLAGYDRLVRPPSQAR